MAQTITDLLNQMNEIGVFSYVLPFMLIFAVVFAILEKSGLLAKSGQENKPVSAIVAAAIALLALQFDQVSIFFANLFPKFGIGVAILLAVLIIMGLAGFDFSDGNSKLQWMGYAVAAGVVIWTLFNWNSWFGGGYSFGFWLDDYFWSLVWIAIVIGVIVLVARPKKPQDNGGGDNSGGGNPPAQR